MANSRKRSTYDINKFDDDYLKDNVISERDERKPSKKKTRKKSEEHLKQDKKKPAKKKKEKGKYFNLVLGILLGVIVVILITTIITGQVQLTELNQEISDAKGTLDEKQSIYTQLEMKVDANLSTAIVEKYAQEKLGMSKASNSQKEFINLSQGDKAEVSVEVKENIFTQIGEAFSSLWPK